MESWGCHEHLTRRVEFRVPADADFMDVSHAMDAALREYRRRRGMPLDSLMPIPPGAVRVRPEADHTVIWFEITKEVFRVVGQTANHPYPAFRETPASRDLSAVVAADD